MNTIKEQREKLGWTQEELANRLNVSRTAVVKWETGAAMPTVRRLMSIANLFGCSIDDLVCDNM